MAVIFVALRRAVRTSWQVRPLAPPGNPFFAERSRNVIENKGSTSENSGTNPECYRNKRTYLKFRNVIDRKDS